MTRDVIPPRPAGPDRHPASASAGLAGPATSPKHYLISSSSKKRRLQYEGNFIFPQHLEVGPSSLSHLFNKNCYVGPSRIRIQVQRKSRYYSRQLRRCLHQMGGGVVQRIKLTLDPNCACSRDQTSTERIVETYLSCYRRKSKTTARTTSGLLGGHLQLDSLLIQQHIFRRLRKMFRQPVTSRKNLIHRLQSILSSSKKFSNTFSSTSTSRYRIPVRYCSSSRIAESSRSPAEEPPKIVGFADVEEVRETGEPSGTI